jgi:hypothetical protein
MVVECQNEWSKVLPKLDFSFGSGQYSLLPLIPHQKCVSAFLSSFTFVLIWPSFL